MRWLKKYIDYKGISVLSFEKSVGTRSTIDKAIKNDSNLRSDLLAKIIETYPEISPSWLLTGEGRMIIKNGSDKNEAEPISIMYKKVHRVPIHAQAGFLNGYGDEAYMTELPTELWEVDKEYKGEYLCFEVRGDSMDDNSANSILEGDRVLCREIQRHHWVNKLHINKWNFVIVHKEEGIIVKRISDHNVEKGIITCHSLNPYYDDFQVNLNDVIALFNVVDMKRNLRL